ncbi:MAG TPA: VWA domain-containing protein [Ktedonobacterales bacterium]|nr:VWA domain-containing protein [Ktedonobacterales bacterium]
MFSRYNYSRWDGTQRIEGLDADEILDALSEDFLREGDLRRAMEKMMREGFQGRNGERRMGLQELMDRLRNRRQQQMQRYNMSSVMDDIQKKLEEVKQMERAGIQRRLDDAAGRPRQPSPEDGAQDQQGQEGEDGQEGTEGQEGAQGQREQSGRQGMQGQRSQAGQRGQMQAGQQRQSGQSGEPQSGSQPGGSGEMPEGLDPDALRKMLEKVANRKLEYLDSLPPDVAGQIKSLSDYDFMDEDARQAFQELLQMLQQQVMQQYFQGMQQAIQNMSPEDLARMREMVRELNQMLREKQEGGEPDFDAFMQKYGDFFGPGINTLDDLIEQMQRQMAQMQAVMDSMSPEQRDELRGMVDQLLGDDRLRVDMMELAMNLDRLSPNEMHTQYNLTGDEPLSLQEAMRLMGRLQGMDELEEQLREARRIGDLEDIDADKVRQLLGDEEGQALEQLQELMKMLEEAGYIQKQGNRWELTARGIRKIGQKALQDIFAQLKKDRFGRHATISRGVGGERIDESKPYQFGDPFLLDLEQTLMNSIHRNGIGTPAKLDKDDFEVYRTEFQTQSATVVMLDMSMSMVYNYCYQAAKRVAVALESLIRGQFPRDKLSIVTFARIARQRKPEELVLLGSYDHEQGTNMAHGLMLARQLLEKQKGTNRQIIMITDGGPTMSYEDGDWWFGMPPNFAAEQQTLREVQRCTRDGIVINTFMLDRDPWMIQFVNEMAQINGGRTFFATPENLGEYILVDYVSNKRKRVRQ